MNDICSSRQINKIVCTKQCCVLHHWKYSDTAANEMRFHSSREERAGCIMINEKDQLLIVQSRGNKWGFPKGKRKDLTESAINCAMREVKEETGLTIQIDETTPHITLNRVTYFIKCIRLKAIDIDTIDVNTDSSGIGWIHTSCLREATIPTTSHTKTILNHRWPYLSKLFANFRFE